MDKKFVLDQMRWRYAVKRFDSAKKIAPQDWEILEQSLILSPSSYGLQPWQFILVQDPETRKKLTPLSWNQSQVADCSHYVVFAILRKLDEAHVDKHLDHVAHVRNVTRDTLVRYREGILKDVVHGPRSAFSQHWATYQAYIALGTLLTTAALLKIDACPMEGIEPREYDKVLGLENSKYATAVACALGYRSETDKYALLPKVRFPKDAVVKIV